ncbi:hypothetical protein GLAREA_03469 [Glarea lozoyensis ATCC 20868]|uniref:Myb-like domain-containing protein n=1 Tax=Glarea lozoyensis (strain ATCC 20868 / MF5171) TaxID=1116229 RepID=S3CVR0_GLAL2|nr:uncharacterized protein GLAREA_03469 [Glarea lozoyensis ATCC 20868]EPE30502.1 hypothetical protein GLAREA_03469 [Glarea lozoyensis ATCC 20868]
MSNKKESNKKESNNTDELFIPIWITTNSVRPFDEETSPWIRYSSNFGLFGENGKQLATFKECIDRDLYRTNYHKKYEKDRFDPTEHEESGWKVKDVYGIQRREGTSTRTILLDTESKFKSEANKMIARHKRGSKEDTVGTYLIVVVDVDTVLDSNNSASSSALPQAEKTIFWSMEEDDALCLLAASYIKRSKKSTIGLSGWQEISDLLEAKNFESLRTPKACKGRWDRAHNRHLYLAGIRDMGSEVSAQGSTWCLLM